MTKFNVGKFNVKSSLTSSVVGVSDISIDSSLNQILVEKYSSEVNSSIILDTNANGYTEIIGIAGNSDLVFETYGLATNLVYGFKGNSTIEIDTHGVGSLLGEDYVEIKDLVLRPGQEIEIDMCNLTVIANGENAMHLMASDGDFFDFLVGENDIDIEAIGGNGIQVDVYWKDRWL